MESDRDFDDTTIGTQRQLDIAERASVAPFVDYPATPRWYAAVVGLWAGGMAAVIPNMGDNKAVTVPLLLALIAIEFGFISWYRRFMGTMPNIKNAPAEIRAEMKRYFVGVVVAFVAIALSLIFVGWWVGAIVAFATVTAGLTIYEHRYAAAAERTKHRLS